MHWRLSTPSKLCRRTKIKNTKIRLKQSGTFFSLMLFINFQIVRRISIFCNCSMTISASKSNSTKKLNGIKSYTVVITFFNSNSLKRKAKVPKSMLKKTKRPVSNWKKICNWRNKSRGFMKRSTLWLGTSTRLALISSRDLKVLLRLKRRSSLQTKT